MMGSQAAQPLDPLHPGEMLRAAAQIVAKIYRPSRSIMKAQEVPLVVTSRYGDTSGLGFEQRR